MAKWNNKSWVRSCPECNGAGVVASRRIPTINDPYPERTCDCGLGEHIAECEVCGFTQDIPGYDCLACETIAALHRADLERLDVAEFAKALTVARQLALAEYANSDGFPLPTASEASVPMVSP